MSNKKLSALVISITPFDDQGRLDEPAFRKHLKRLRDAGVSVWVAGSGSSEGYALTPEERERVLAIAVEELKGRVPVRAMGCEPRLPSHMVEFVRCAERAGVDAAQIFSLDIGHGAKPTLAELDRYYSTVIDATSLPVVLSSHHAAGYYLPLDLIETLAQRYPTFTGINYGGTDLHYLSQLIARFRDRLEIHCAGPRNAMTVLVLGGNGFMGHEGNLAPQLVQSVISTFEAGDMLALRESWGKLLALDAIVKRYGGSTLRGLKPLLNAFGLPGGTLRLPRIAISDVDLDAMIKAVLQLRIAELPEVVRR